ncbi:MAG: hypothetical protein ABL874_02515 [Sphingopyxis sp.]
MDMHWQPPAAQTGDQMRETRVSKLLTFEISSPRHPRAKIVVRNLSPHGVGVRSDLNVIACEHLTLHLPGGQDLDAIVRWTKKGTFGLSLDARIEPEMLRPASQANGHFTPSDTVVGFERMLHQGTTERSGFQRTHKQQVLSSSQSGHNPYASQWTND